MKTISRLLSSILLLGALLAAPAQPLHAQQATPASGSETVKPTRPHMDEPENGSQEEQYRHSAMVQSIARTMHVSTETAAQIFEDFNSGVLIFVIGFFLWKFVPGMFRRRSDTLKKELTTAHAATEDANRRLAEVEARLSRLDREVEAIRLQADKDLAEDEKRLAASIETEKERIVASAEQEIAAAQAAAQRELKKFAADLAIDSAMRRIQLTADTDRALVKEFGSNLSGGSGGKA